MEESKANLFFTEGDYEVRHHGIDCRHPSTAYAVSFLQLFAGIEEEKKHTKDHSQKKRSSLQSDSRAGEEREKTKNEDSISDIEQNPSDS